MLKYVMKCRSQVRYFVFFLVGMEFYDDHDDQTCRSIGRIVAGQLLGRLCL